VSEQASQVKTFIVASVPKLVREVVMTKINRRKRHTMERWGTRSKVVAGKYEKPTYLWGVFGK
jgi:hypothetical protein